jgi:hypothetical protein
VAPFAPQTGAFWMWLGLPQRVGEARAHGRQGS